MPLLALHSAPCCKPLKPASSAASVWECGRGGLRLVCFSHLYMVCCLLSKSEFLTLIFHCLHEVWNTLLTFPLGHRLETTMPKIDFVFLRGC